MKSILFSFAFILFGLPDASAQPVTKTYTAKFIPRIVTYNASDDPGECWEAVATGIVIEDGNVAYFFSMSELEMEKIKEKIGDEEVVVEVVFYSESFYDSGEDGKVVKITLKGEIIFLDA